MDATQEMTISAGQFRLNFPVFKSEANYPVGVIEFYLVLAYLLLNAERWSTMLDYGVQFFVAHNITLERAAQAAANKGQAPGTAAGPVASKGAGPLSIAWDTTSGAELDAGHWNDTSYGRRYIRLARIVGIGGVQLGVGSAPPFSGGAWSGPPPWPGWFSS